MQGNERSRAPLALQDGRPGTLLHVIDEPFNRRDVARLDHRVAAVVVDEQVMVVTAEQEIDRTRSENLVILGAAGVRDGNHEIRAFAAQELGLAPGREVYALVKTVALDRGSYGRYDATGPGRDEDEPG